MKEPLVVAPTVKRGKGPPPEHMLHKLNEVATFEVLHTSYDHPVPGTGGKQHITFEPGDMIRTNLNLEAMYKNKFRRVDTPAAKRKTVKELPTIKDADPLLKARAKTNLANTISGSAPGKVPTAEELDAASKALSSEPETPTEPEEEGEDESAAPLGEEVTNQFKKLIGDLPYQVFTDGEKFSIVNTKKHKIITRKTTGKVRAFFKGKKE